MAFRRYRKHGIYRPRIIAISPTICIAIPSYAIISIDDWLLLAFRIADDARLEQRFLRANYRCCSHATGRRYDAGIITLLRSA